MNNGTQTATYLTIGDIAKNYRVTRQTVCRWLTAGVEGVRLAGTCVGRQWRIDPDDLEQFFEAIKQNRLPPDAAHTPEAIDSPSRLKKRHEAALERLRAKGMKC